MHKKLTYILSAVVLSLISLCSFAQQRDSIVYLMSSKMVQMVDVEGASYRRIVGPARFLHNGTYLLCDTAMWNVDTKVIEAWGNVRILQDETVLDSDKLTYLIDQDVAQFRGTVVQLQDKDHNTLRTRHLDYNTKDSVAVFRSGGSMRDKDGQIIESDNGTYDSKVKTFTFVGDVNMFTDSIFVKSGKLKYESELNMATFSAGTDAWKDDNMLSSSRGWYDRAREIFFFNDRVHVMSEEHEGWSDSLFFYRMTSDVELLGNVQVSDTTRNVYALAGKIHYADSSSTVTLTRQPAVITQTEEQDGSVDTVYLGAEKLVYKAIRKCDIDSLEFVAAKARLENMAVDPVGNYRKKAAEEAARAAEEAAKNDPNYRPKEGKPTKPAKQDKQNKQDKSSKPDIVSPADSQSVAAVDSLVSVSVDSLTVGMDSLVVAADSLAAGRDSLALADSVSAPVAPKDTSKIGFLEAMKKVKVYKKDMQLVCDSLHYNDLDSIARMFVNPIIWQEKVRQYSADSIFVAVSQGTISKASLMSNSFITIKEDSLHFDQIKGTEMIAYFGQNSSLERFDVLGGASAVFFIEEKETLATVNKTDSKMLSAVFKDGEIERVYYYDEPKNDGYPLVQLTEDEQKLKGFKWEPALRPADRNAVTSLSLRPSQRNYYNVRPKAKFVNTEIYFPGYIGDINRQIQVRDSLRVIRDRERRMMEILQKEQEARRADSLALADSLDALMLKDSLAVADSLKLVSDSLAVSADSLAVADSVSVDSLSPEQSRLEKKEKKAAERAARRKARIEAREKRWEELDKRDADLLKQKEEKEKSKLREKKRKALKDAARQAEKDAEVLERYRQKYLKKLEKEQQRKSRKTVK